MLCTASILAFNPLCKPLNPFKPLCIIANCVSIWTPLQSEHGDDSVVLSLFCMFLYTLGAHLMFSKRWKNSSFLPFFFFVVLKIEPRTLLHAMQVSHLLTGWYLHVISPLCILVWEHWLYEKCFRIEIERRKRLFLSILIQ